MRLISGVQGAIQSSFDSLESQTNSLGRETFRVLSLPDDIQVEELVEVPQGTFSLDIWIEI